MDLLSHGCTGDDVSTAQAALNFHQTDDNLLTVDGQFGNQTRARTMAFQAAAGLNPDGIIGSQTESRLLATTQVLSVIRYVTLPSGGAPALAMAGRPVAMPVQFQAQRAFGSPAVPAFPPLPPLTLPVPGVAPVVPGVTAKLKLDLPLLAGTPTTLPQRPSAAQLTGPMVEFFVLKGTLLAPLASLPSPVPQLFTQATPTTKFESLTTLVPGQFTFASIIANLYVKGKMTKDPDNPSDATIKFLGGASASLTSGRFALSGALDVTFFKWSSPTGIVKWGPSVDASLQVQYFF